jgi:mannosyltransferase
MLSNSTSPDRTSVRPSGIDAGHSSFWLWMIVVVGAALRLIALGHKSFWIDEIASVAIARRATPVFWHFLWHDEGNMAAYYVLLRPWLRLGYGEGTVRLLSVIPAILSIPLMYVLGRRLFGREVGVVAALFFALNACAISVSQEARAYSFVVLLVLLSTYLFVQLIELPTQGVAFAYAVIAGLTCYFHYFGVLVPAAHFAVVLGLPANRRAWRMLLPAAGVIAVIVAPMLWLIHAQDTGHISWVTAPSLLEFYHLGAFLAADSGKAVGAVLLVLDLALVGVFLKNFKSTWSGDPEGRWRYLLVLSLVATPIVLTLLVSIVRPAFYHRFLIICLPGWVLMTALGAQQLRRRSWRAVAIAAVCALSLVSVVILYRRVAEDWRGAVNYLIAVGRSSDRVLYYQSVGEFAGENYHDWLPGGDAPRPMPIAVDPANPEWQQQVDGASVVWVVLYRAKPSDTEMDRIQQGLAQHNFSVRLVTFYPGVTVMKFSSKP